MQPARLPKASVPLTYRWIAPVHDLLAVVVEAKARNLAMEWAMIEPGEHVLEVAVGTGLTFERVLRRNPTGRNVGIDATPAMLRRAQRRAAHFAAPSYALRIGDAYAIDEPEDTFDVVFNSYMFDMLPRADFVPVLREFFRVLRPGGRLVMMNMTLGPRWYHGLWETAYRLAPPLLGGCRGVCVEPFLASAGFIATRRAFVSQWTFPSEVLFAQKPQESQPNADR